MPVRSVGPLDIPACGGWPLVPTSHVAIAPGRGADPIPVRILGGVFEIDRPPELSTLRIELSGRRDMTFVGQPARIAVNRSGLSDWSIVGSLMRGRRAELLTCTISYHGLVRKGDTSWAWFSGKGFVDPPTSSRRWRRSSTSERRLVVLDLHFARRQLDRSREPRTAQAMI